MSQTKYNKSARKFKHLTEEKRAQIEIMMRMRVPKTRIAAEMNISRSTLYNELKRGAVVQMDTNLKTYVRYFSDVGQRVYEERRSNSRPPLKITKAAEFVEYAQEQILTNKLSPDAICGMAKETGAFEETVCTKTLYHYIDMCFLRVRNIDLPLVTRRGSRKTFPRNVIKRGRSIEERPISIDLREEFGHWEIDTVKGGKGSRCALLTLDERVTRFRHIIRLPDCTRESVSKGIALLKDHYAGKFNEVFKSITSDNGSEFASLEEAVGVPVYYAHPYSACERGTNEKQNSLIRRFIPKGKNLSEVSDKEISRIEKWINQLPRKIFQYRTAENLFSNVLFDIAI